jgi:hypothetical protein
LVYGFAIEVLCGLRSFAASSSPSARPEGKRSVPSLTPTTQAYVATRSTVTSTKQKPARHSCLSTRRGQAAFTLPLPDRPFPNPTAICEQGPDGWTLLVNPDTGASVALNPTGTLIWRLANGKRTVGDIVAGIRRRYPDAPGSVADDVAGLLGTLSDEGLIGREVQTGWQRKRL